jgi:hypothetical protein
VPAGCTGHNVERVTSSSRDKKIRGGLFICAQKAFRSIVILPSPYHRYQYTMSAHDQQQEIYTSRNNSTEEFGGGRSNMYSGSLTPGHSNPVSIPTSRSNSGQRALPSHGPQHGPRSRHGREQSRSPGVFSPTGFSSTATNFSIPDEPPHDLSDSGDSPEPLPAYRLFDDNQGDLDLEGQYVHFMMHENEDADPM